MTVLEKIRGLLFSLTLKPSWFKKPLESVPTISFFFSSIYIWEKVYWLSFESITLIFPADLKKLSDVEYSKLSK